jgi:hypothetical protein
MGFSSVACTNFIARSRILCFGDFEKALCRFPFCFLWNSPDDVIRNRFFQLL